MALNDVKVLFSYRNTILFSFLAYSTLLLYLFRLHYVICIVCWLVTSTLLLVLHTFMASLRFYIESCRYNKFMDYFNIIMYGIISQLNAFYLSSSQILPPHPDFKLRNLCNISFTGTG